MQEHFQVFARYNAWANHRLYGAVAKLPEAAVVKQRPAAFFGSILGTLNHILVADRIWMGRVERMDVSDLKLDGLLYEELESLKRARLEEDRRIMIFVDRMSSRDYQRTMGYKNTKGESHSATLGQIFAHLFNHQTHHRGQVHALLSEAAGSDPGAAPPPLDLIYFLKAA